MLVASHWNTASPVAETHGKKCTGICFADNQMCCSWAYIYNNYILYI